MKLFISRNAVDEQRGKASATLQEATEHESLSGFRSRCNVVQVGTEAGWVMTVFQCCMKQFRMVDGRLFFELV